MTNTICALFAAPFLRRIGSHAKRLRCQTDRHFFTSLLSAIIGFVIIAALAIRRRSASATAKAA